MKKILFASLVFAAACGKSQNVAELRVKSDVPAAKCASGVLSDGTSVTKCGLKTDDGKQTVTLIGAVGGDFPFQSWTYRTTTQIKELAKAQDAAQGAGSGSAPSTLTPSTGSAAGSGSGSAGK